MYGMSSTWTFFNYINVALFQYVTYFGHGNESQARLWTETIVVSRHKL